MGCLLAFGWQKEVKAAGGGMSVATKRGYFPATAILAFGATAVAVAFEQTRRSGKKRRKRSWWFSTVLDRSEKDPLRCRQGTWRLWSLLRL